MTVADQVSELCDQVGMYRRQAEAIAEDRSELRDEVKKLRAQIRRQGTENCRLRSELSRSRKRNEELNDIVHRLKHGEIMGNETDKKGKLSISQIEMF